MNSRDKGRELHANVDRFKNLLSEVKGHIERLQELDSVECEYRLGYDDFCGGGSKVIRINAPIDAVMKRLNEDAVKFTNTLQACEKEYLDWSRNG